MPTAIQRKIYKVSQLTQEIKILLEGAFPEVWVQGEVSNFRRPSSGHIYFTLKDASAQLKCVFFRGYNQKLKFQLSDGQQVICFGKIGVYQIEGQYQLYVQNVEPKGIGALQLAFEQLKKKLEKQGLFDTGHKRPLPVFPRRVGIVTSPTGAAIRDMINILRRRAPFIKIIIRPVRVQGDGASLEIATGIKEFNEFGGVDAIIVARGGGSLEDLWPFNEEALARAIYNSKIPIISAVGHQIDYTISDFVADVRAATPSEAAEIVVKKKEELQGQIEGLLTTIREHIKNAIVQHTQSLDEYISSLNFNINHILELYKEKTKGLIARLALLNPRIWIQKEMRQLEHLKARLHQKLDYYFSINRQRFLSHVSKLEALSPLKVLSRGYSISFHMPTKKIISDIRYIKINDKIRTVLKKGSFISKVIKKHY